MPPDPKPESRVRDLEVLKALHTRWRGTCALEGLGECDTVHYSLHHIHRHPRDDVEANLVMLCGDGVRGHHGQITAESPVARAALGRYLRTYRLDTLSYLSKKLGGVVQAGAWLERSL